MIIVYEYGIEIDETYMLNKEFEELVLEEERAARITFNFFSYYNVYVTNGHILRNGFKLMKFIEQLYFELH